MFNIFKKKPTLSELIPNGFVDIHSHVLPGIDDGAKDIEESIVLINKMKDLGFSKIIATPHTYQGVHDNTNETIKSSYDLLRKNINEEIEISYASEYMLDDSIYEKIQKKSLLELKNKHVLVEMSYISPPLNLYEIIFELQTSGYNTILAHPERYRFLHNNFNQYRKLKLAGCKFQINLLSTTGYYGPDIVKISDKLLKNNYIDYVGSDIHSKKHILRMNDKIKIKSIEVLNKCIEQNNFFK